MTADIVRQARGSGDLTTLWNQHKLAKDDVEGYIRYEATKGLMEEEIDHITNCCWGIYEYCTRGTPPGHFLTALLRNDLMDTVGKADNINVRNLDIYMKFCYNVAPANILWEARKKLGGKRG